MQFRQTAAKIEPAGESEPVRVDINNEGTKTSAEPIYYDEDKEAVSADEHILKNSDLVDNNKDPPISSTLPWWKRHRQSLVLLALLVLLVICITEAVIIGVFVGNKESATDTAASMAAATCDTYRVVFQGAVFDNDCDHCYPLVEIDGHDAAITANDNDSGYVKFFSNADTKLKEVATFDYDDYIGPLAMSGDIAVAGTFQETTADAAYAFGKDASGRWNQVMRIEPDEIAQQAFLGSSVDADGDVLVLGASEDGDNAEGSALIYRLVDTTWRQEAKITPVDSNLEDFGTSVSVKGTLIAVSDVYYGSLDKGAVFVYEFDSSKNTWSQLNDPITNDDCDKEFGSSVVLVEDKSLLIGCAGDNKYTGAVYFYSLSVTGDKYLFRQKIVPSDGAPDDWFGDWGQIGVDGNIMLVASLNENRDTTYFYIFAMENNAWREVAKVAAPADSAEFGNMVYFSGRTALVASNSNAYLYSLEDC